MRTLAAALLYCILLALLALLAICTFSCDVLGMIVDWLEDLMERIRP